MVRAACCPPYRLVRAAGLCATRVCIGRQRLETRAVHGMLRLSHVARRNAACGTCDVARWVCCLVYLRRHMLRAARRDASVRCGEHGRSHQNFRRRATRGLRTASQAQSARRRTPIGSRTGRPCAAARKGYSRECSSCRHPRALCPWYSSTYLLECSSCRHPRAGTALLRVACRASRVACCCTRRRRIEYSWYSVRRIQPQPTATMTGHFRPPAPAGSRARAARRRRR